MRILGLIIKSQRKYTEAIAEHLDRTAYEKCREFDRGFELGFKYAQDWERSKTIIAPVIKEVYEILWTKENREGEL